MTMTEQMLAADALSDAAKFSALFARNGFDSVEITREPLGYAVVFRALVRGVPCKFTQHVDVITEMTPIVELAIRQKDQMQAFLVDSNNSLTGEVSDV